MNYYVYVLLSLKDGGLYIGISSDPAKRVQGHNQGQTKSTKGRRPFRLVYVEKCLTRHEARQKEKRFKSGSGRESLRALIQKTAPIAQLAEQGTLNAEVEGSIPSGRTGEIAAVRVAEIAGGYGGTGRRAGLRILSRKGWGFNSL